MLGGAKVSEEMIQGWFGFSMRWTHSLLAKSCCLSGAMPATVASISPRVFTEPTTLDLVLWIQGTGAAPYLEKGTITSSEFWATTNRVFRGEFLGFALWFN